MDYVKYLAHELFSSMLTLSQLESQERILRAFLDTINALPGAASFRLLGPQEMVHTEVIELATPHHSFGRIAVEGDVTGRSPEFLALIKDAARMAAIILESRFQQARAADQNLQLEAAVAQRTAELLEANEKLSAEIAKHEQAEEALRQRNRELALLNRVIAVSMAGKGPEAMLETACREMTGVFEVAQVTAALFNKEQATATIVAEHCLEERLSTRNPIFPIGSDPSSQYILTHKVPFVVHDSPPAPRLAAVQEPIRRAGIKTVLILPLIVNDEAVGNLTLATVRPRKFSRQEIDLAWRVTGQVAGVLARTWLDQERQRLSTAIEQTAESVIITDTEGTLLYVNPAFEQINGYSQAEVVGWKANLLKSGKHEPAFYQKLWSVISTGQVWTGRMINKKKDGTLYTAETIISPVQDERGVIINYVGLQRDVTAELQLAAQYQQAQKMEAVGRLAGGVAHDFNNLLTAIMSYVGLALPTLDPNNPVYEDIQGIQKTAQRAANLTRQLLTFARRQIVAPEPLDLNDLILDMDKMLQRLIRENIELVTLPAPDLGQVKADLGQIEQVLVNLVVNARDAMPDGGRLTIQTTNVTLDEEYALQHAGVEPGEYVMLAVSDTGVGMAEAVKAHIFEPFFTTKETGKGSGLGLATCFGIVKQSGGHIWFYSEVDQGTIFRIYLPRLKEAARTTAGPANLTDSPRGLETILLVEDETSVRELAGRTLRRQGYTVLSAANGQEALQLLQRQPQTEIHLLLTDVVMPGIGGRALANELKTGRPHLKTLFTSGYTDDAIIHTGILEMGSAFLQKPFSPLELIRKVRKVLDGRP